MPLSLEVRTRTKYTYIDKIENIYDRHYRKSKCIVLFGRIRLKFFNWSSVEKNYLPDDEKRPVGFKKEQGEISGQVNKKASK